MAGFDPDAYLAQEKPKAAAPGAPGFDPDAFLGGAAPAPTEPGRREAFLRGGAQGATLGYGDEATGLIQALPTTNPMGNPLAALADAVSDVPESQKALARQVDRDKEALDAQGPGGRLRALARDYGLNRDAARREDVAAKEAHGGYYLGGNLAGGALPAPLAPGGAVKTAGQAALQGAKLGAAAGLGGSEADLLKGEVGGALGDTALGAGLGALVGAGVQQLPRAIGAGVQRLRDLGEGVAARLGRRVLQGGSESLSKGKAIPDETVLDAIRRGIIRFGGTTKGAAERAASMAEEAGSLYGSILKELESAGVQGPNAHRIAAEVAQEAGQQALVDPIGAGPPLMQRFAEKLGEQYQPGAADMPLGVAEGMKRTLQKAASKDFEALARGGGSELQSAAEGRIALADKLKTAIEDAVEQQASKAPEAAARFQPAKAESAALIRLRQLAEKGLAKTQKRGPLGLMDMLSGVAGTTAAHGPLGLLATPASALLRAVGPSSGATTALATSELAGALQGLPAAAEMALPGVGRAALTAGMGAGQALQERLAQALRGKKLSPAESEELQRQLAQAEALRQP